MYNTISLCILLSLLSSPTSSTTHLCLEEGECENQRLICSSKEACYVQCSANWACRGTTIECPIGNECHIKCHYDGEGDIASNAQLLCLNMVIEAGESTLLTINASIGNQPNFASPRTLESAIIHCPNNKNAINGYKPCQIYCDGDDLMRGTTIMAMGGTNDLFIEAIRYSRRWCIRSTELKCGANYSISCSLTNQAPFSCQDSNIGVDDQTCETLVVDPTISPIFSTETITPSQSPSNHPTASPINNTETGVVPETSIESEIDVEVETTKIGDRDRLQLTNGELILVIIIPLFFCAIMVIGGGCWMLKGFQQQSERRSHHHKKVKRKSITPDTDDENVRENGYYTKEIHDGEMVEYKEEKQPLYTEETNMI